MLDLNDMRLFAKVAELQGFNAAAEALQIPKSRVSRRVSLLEASLGVRLVERTTRAFNLTEAGAAFLKHCRDIESEATRALETVQTLAHAPRGLLRINTSVTLGQSILAPLIAEFTQQYPDIQIELSLTNRRVDLIAEGFDMVLRVGEMDDSSLICRRLAADVGQLFASPDYLARYAEPRDISSLNSHRLLVMASGDNTNRWHFLNTAGEQAFINIQPSVVANDFSSIRTMAEAGCGIAKLPSYYARPLVKEGKLNLVLADWQSPPFSYSVLYPSHKSVTHKLRLWIDFLALRVPILVNSVALSR